MNREVDEELTASAVDSCLALMQAMHAAATPAICHMDVTMSQVKAMLTIAMKSVATVGDIAQSTQVGLPSASVTVDRLVGLGWVDRSEDPQDRRRTLLRLTDEGRQVVETVWRLRRDLLSRWVSRLGLEDLAALAQGLSALNRVARDDVGSREMAAAP